MLLFVRNVRFLCKTVGIEVELLVFSIVVAVWAGDVDSNVVLDPEMLFLS